jgi:RHS repeat-associated protein
MRYRISFILAVIVLFIGALVFVAIKSPSAMHVGQAALPVVGGEQSVQTSGSVVYVYGKGLIVSKDAGELTFHMQDSLSSNRLAVDRAGQLESKTVFYPYGKSVERGRFSANVQKYTYTGKEDDGLLFYYGARYYDGRIGRFISVDPIPRYESQYVYSSNNPVGYHDTDGKALPVLVGAIAAIGEWMTAAAADPNNAMDMNMLMMDIGQGNTLGTMCDVAGLLLPGVNNVMVRTTGEAFQVGAGKVGRIFQYGVKFKNQGSLAETRQLGNLVMKRGSILEEWCDVSKGQRLVDEYKVLAAHNGLDLLPNPQAIAREDGYIYVFKDFMPGERVGSSAQVDEVVGLGKRLGQGYAKTGITLEDLHGANVLRKPSGLDVVDFFQGGGRSADEVPNHYRNELWGLVSDISPQNSDHLRVSLEIAVKDGISSGGN